MTSKDGEIVRSGTNVMELSLDGRLHAVTGLAR
jgi:hypothetical protein